MNKLKKISAFTVGELLVVMVISSIVVTIAFLSLSNIQRQVRKVNTTFELQQKILRLERVLVQDFQLYQSRLDRENQTLVFFSGNDTVWYFFDSNKVIRQRDTLELTQNKLTLYLEGNKITQGDFDAIELSFSETYNQQGFFLSKKKDAAYYMNN